MPKKYPPLTDGEVVAILRALGFGYSHSAGGHDFYKKTHSGKAHTVNVDPKHSPFDDFLLKSMISQSGYGRKSFYAATKKTAKKIGVKVTKEAAD
jgi:predicted RNA binding protein YcfA (HicA-like mRNA interferase family)